MPDIRGRKSVGKTNAIDFKHTVHQYYAAVTKRKKCCYILFLINQTQITICNMFWIFVKFYIHYYGTDC